jgi:hypothetical protein
MSHGIGHGYLMFTNTHAGGCEPRLAEPIDKKHREERPSQLQESNRIRQNKRGRARPPVALTFCVPSPQQ